MPREYTVNFPPTTVSAAQDLVAIYGATGKMCRILRCWVASTDTTLDTGQMLSLRLRFLPATVTPGSGGSAATPQALDPGDASASFTAAVNNTTKATTNGTASILEENGCHIYSGYDVHYSKPKFVGPSEAFVFELLSSVSGTVNLSGGVLVEESGG